MYPREGEHVIRPAGVDLVVNWEFDNKKGDSPLFRAYHPTVTVMLFWNLIDVTILRLIIFLFNQARYDHEKRTNAKYK